MTINVHSLLHLVEDVRNLGPLWCHSCFIFENMNGVLKALFHGSQQVNKQVHLLVTFLSAALQSHWLWASFLQYFYLGMQQLLLPPTCIYNIMYTF